MKSTGIREIKEVIDKHLELLKNDVEVEREDDAIVIKIKDPVLSMIIQHLEKSSNEKCILCMLENDSLIEKFANH